MLLTHGVCAEHSTGCSCTPPRLSPTHPAQVAHVIDSWGTNSWMCIRVCFLKHLKKTNICRKSVGCSYIFALVGPSRVPCKEQVLVTGFLWRDWPHLGHCFCGSAELPIRFWKVHRKRTIRSTVCFCGFSPFHRKFLYLSFLKSDSPNVVSDSGFSWSPIYYVDPNLPRPEFSNHWPMGWRRLTVGRQACFVWPTQCQYLEWFRIKIELSSFSRKDLATLLTQSGMAVLPRSWVAAAPLTLWDAIGMPNHQQLSPPLFFSELRVHRIWVLFEISNGKNSLGRFRRPESPASSYLTLGCVSHSQHLIYRPFVHLLWKRCNGQIGLGNSGSSKGELASLMQDFSEPWYACVCQVL